MKDSITIVPVLWSRKDKNGLYPVKIRITKNRKSSYISIGHSLKKIDWSEFKKRVKTTHPKHFELNQVLEGFLKELENENPQKDLTNKSIFFPDYINKQIQIKEQGENMYSTKRYKSLKTHLGKFIGQDKKVHFKDIDKDFVIQFRLYLESNIDSRNNDNKPSVNTVVNYLKVFRTLVNHAIKDDTYKGGNPILNHLIPAKGRKKKVPLTSNQIWKLNNLKPIKPRMTEGMYHALNVFMFSFWSRGLRISDVLQLKYKHFTNGYFSIKMNKTKEVVNVPLTINNVERIIPYILGSTPLFDWNKKKYFIASVIEEEEENYIGIDTHDELFSFYSVYMRYYFAYEKLLMERVLDYNDHIRSKNRSNLYFHDDFEFDSKEISNIFKNSEIIEEKLAYDEYLENRERYLEYCRIFFKKYCKSKEIQDQYVFPFLRGYEHLKGFKLGEKVSAITALINKNLYKISDRFDLPKFTTHYARHSFTSLSKSIGVDIYELRNWLGHTSVKNTEIYVNTLDEPTEDPHSLRLYDSLNS